jgi:hypothetical protein
LLGRAADVVLKERRPLVLVPRESPLSDIHLENMLALSRMGVRIVPPMPAFYNRPQMVEDARPIRLAVQPSEAVAGNVCCTPANINCHTTYFVDQEKRMPYDARGLILILHLSR